MWVCGRSEPRAVSVCQRPFSSSYSMTSVCPGTVCSSAALRGGEGISMRWIGFREHAVHFVRPPAIVFDDLVRHLRHRKPSGTRKVLGYRIAISTHCASHLWTPEAKVT